MRGWGKYDKKEDEKNSKKTMSRGVKKHLSCNGFSVG